jgi:RHS repeat-associated protein
MKAWICLDIPWARLFVIVLCSVSLSEAGPPVFLPARDAEIAERGPHHRTWQTVVPKLTSYGKVYYQTNEVIELQTGLHRLTAEGWVESTPRIEVVGNVGAVRGLQYSVEFAGNLAAVNPVTLVMPDGRRLSGGVYGLAFMEGDRSVLLAQVKDCIGEISGAEQNVLTFRDAFTDIPVDVQFVVERGRFSQSVIFKGRVPDPASFGLTDKAVLTLLTEFTQSPHPDKEPRVWQGETGVKDEQISFGGMRFITGRAFAAGSETEQAHLVGKAWDQLLDETGTPRTFLLEQVPWTSIRSDMEKLPAANVQAGIGTGAKGNRMAAKGLNILAAKKTAKASGGIQMARVDVAKQAGFVLDYELVVTTNFFEFGPKTYYVSGPVSIVTNRWLGGAVVKFAPTNSAKITLTGPMSNLASEGHPIVLTARDDHSVGEQIGTNTLNGVYASTALVIDSVSSGVSSTNSHFRIAHAALGIQYLGGSAHLISHAQFVNCQRVFEPSPAQFWLRNVLIYNASNIISGSQVSTCRMEHVTMHLANYLNASGACSNRMTNTLLVAVTNIGQYSGSFVQTTNSDTGVFLTQGFGQHYLPTNSPFRSASVGSNVTASLATQMKNRTTHPPALIATNIFSDLVLDRYVPRDTNTIGFHYEALDYIMCGVFLDAFLRVTNGASVGMEFGSTNYSILLDEHADMVSVGAPLAQNRFLRTHSVQELPTGLNPAYPMWADNLDGSSVSLEFRFTDIPLLSGSWLFNQENNRGSFGSILLRDSQVRGGNIYFSPSVTNQMMGWINTLFERVETTIYPYTPTVLEALNCLFEAGSLSLLANEVQGAQWYFFDNQFDRTLINQHQLGTYQHDYNAYLNGYSRITNPIGAHDIVLTNVMFDVGALGNYYQRSGGVLTNAGSQSATSAGLYHYTTTTNQVPETNSWVDIGLHYCALDAQGQPLDSNTNGAPNYVEDADGDGIVGTGESPFTALWVMITSPSNGTNITAGENLTIDASVSANYIVSGVEFYNGTNLINQDLSAPYGITWNNVPAGIHTLWARVSAYAWGYATSVPVTINANNVLFVAGSNVLTATENDLKMRMQTNLGLFSLVKDDDNTVSLDSTGKRLIVISRSADANKAGDRFLSNAVPIFTWQETNYAKLKMTDTNSLTSFGLLTARQKNAVLLPSHPIPDGLTNTNDMTSNTWTFVWGNPTTNAVRVTRLTGSGSSNYHYGIFGYESNALMFGMEAPARRLGFFLGNAPLSDMTSNGLRVLTNAIKWAIETNTPPVVNWVAPTNGSTFIASTNVKLAATASDNDSGLKKVNFYRSGVRIGQATTVSNTTYSLVWSNAVAGNHLLTAKAFDQGGIWSTSVQFTAVTILSNALLVTQSTNLNASETVIKSRLEGLGLVVTTKAATNVATADALGKTVLVISSSAAATNITNKFTMVQTPVVVWQKDLFDDLGMTGTNATNYGITTAQTQLTILSAGHPLAAGLSSTVTVLTNATDVSWGRPGSNAVNIASVVGDSTKVTIFGYDKGKLMAGVAGSTLAAPARRVGFFLSVSNAASLNTNGWALFDAAVKWAMEKACPDSVDTFLVMDVSKSLSDPDFLRSKKSSSNFVNFLKSTVDRVGLVSFAGDVQIDSLLTTNGPAVQSLILGLPERSGTYLHDAIKAAHTNMPPGLGNIVRAMILSSDGIISTNASGINNSNLAVTAATNAKNEGIRIIAIGYGTNTDGQSLLKNIASSSEDYIYSPDVSEFGDIYAAIADSLCRFDVPPSVTLTNPADGQIFVAPSNIQIDATAVDAAGFVVSLEFFADATSLGKLTNPPWSLTWSNAPYGSHMLQAVATDNSLLKGTSSPVAITIRVRPMITIDTPTNNQTFAAPANISVSATASDVDGMVTNVSFFNGTTKLAEFTTVPYSFTWSNVLGGNYTLRAEARDNHGLSATSQVSVVVIKQNPTISIYHPTDGSVFASPVSLEIKAAPLDVDGQITNVQFFAGSTSLGNVTTPPFNWIWTNVPAGTHNLKATAWDNDGLTNNQSAIVTISVTSCTTNGIQSLAFSTNSLLGGFSTTGTVTLASAAGPAGQAVNLSASIPFMSVPPSIVVPAGESSATFRIDSRTVNESYTGGASYIRAQIYGSSVQSNLNLVPPNFYATNSLQNECGPMDVAFIIDLSLSMIDSLHAIQENIPSIVNSIEFASGGDYRLALLSVDGIIKVKEQFAPTNRVSFTNQIALLQIVGGFSAEHTEEAINTVIHALPATNRMQDVDFTNTFRSGVRRVVVLITDEGPSGFTNAGTYVPEVRAHLRGVDAFLHDVQICVAVPSSQFESDAPYWYDEAALKIGEDYARTSGGFFSKANPPDPNNPFQIIEDIHVVIANAISQCGSTRGELVYVREDLNQLYYASVDLKDSAKEARAYESGRFDLEGLVGTVRQAHMNREGQLRVNYGSHFDVQLGASSFNATEAACFGTAITNAHAFRVAYTYASDFELPFTFYPDLQFYLGSMYPLEWLDRVSSTCGNTFEVLDRINADWPLNRNQLTVKVFGRFEIPQGRCRDLVLPESTNAPTLDTWQILLYDQPIVSACAPHGWSVERDYSVYGGFNLCVPADAPPSERYEVRYRDAQSTNASWFIVLPFGARETAPVLKPMVMTPTLAVTGTVVEVKLELDAPATGEGAFVRIKTSGMANTNIPSFVHIPAGQPAASFAFRLAPAVNATNFEVSASWNGYCKAIGQIVVQDGPPTAPMVTATPDTSSIRITWTSVPNALYYQIDRLDAECFDPFTVASRITETCFVDESVPAGTTVCYQVTAVNTNEIANGSTTSDCACAQMTGNLTRPYIAPRGGKFDEFVEVTLTNASPGSWIRYTLDATEPTASNGEYYNEPLLITTNTTVTAKSFNVSTESAQSQADFYIGKALPLTCNSITNAPLALTNWPSIIRGAGYAAQRFRVEGIRAYAASIYVESQDVDTFLCLLDANLNLIAVNDDYFGPSSWLNYTFKSNATYFIEVSSRYAESNGTFTLTLDCFQSPELDLLSNGASITNFSTLDFGITPVSVNLNQTLTITNVGSATLVVSNLAATPAGVFSVSPAAPLVIATNGYTNLTVTFIAANTGAFTGTLTFNSNEGDNGDGRFDPGLLNLVAHCNPTGAPPTVTLTSPINNQLIVAPTALNVAATATAGSSSVSNVQFFAYGPTGKVFIGLDTSSPYAVTWSSFTGGVYSVRAEVYDTAGRYNQSSWTTMMVNQAPVARDDRESMWIGSWQEPLDLLKNDSDADKDPLSILSFGTPSHGSVTNIGGVLHYSPVASYTGADSFSYTITDGREGTATATVNLTIMPWVMPDPVAVITTPAGNIEVTGPTNIFGTASSPYLQFWELKYFRVGDYARGWVTFAEGETSTNGLLGTFDPTLLPNGTYKIVLKVVDFSGTAMETFPRLIKTVEGPKIGHFTLSFNDLEIPVAGLPITITRTYDSRNTAPGDFGAGWRLDVSSIRVQKAGVLGAGWLLETNLLQTCVVDGPEPHTIQVVFPDRTYDFAAIVKLNYGDTHCTGIGGIQWAEARLGFLGLGNTVGHLGILNPPLTLDVNPTPAGAITLHENRGDTDDLFGPIYDGAEFVFTNLPGDVFEFDAAGKLVKLTDRNTNSLRFGQDGIIHSTGKSIRFFRDTSGRITEIYDPLSLDENNETIGPAAVIYKYDARGNLESVSRLVDRAAQRYLITSNAYEYASNPNYLTAIHDPRGIPGIRNEYDATGRLVATMDASGKRTTFLHDLNGHKEIIVDRLGNTNTFSYDAKGNITNSVNALGHTNLFTFDSNNNKLSEVNPLGERIAYTYDGNNQLLSMSNAAGIATFTYNQFGQPLTKMDPLGRGVTNTYDAKGNLLSVLNAVGAQTTFTYDSAGNVTSLKDGLNAVTTNRFDSSGRLTSAMVINAEGQILTTNSWAYDANGNRTNQTIRRTAAGGATLTESTAYIYDAENRLTRVVAPDGKTNELAFNEIGKPAVIVDPLNRARSYEYDVRGHLASVIYPDSRTAAYSYDAEGRKTFQTNQLGQVTEFVYDALGRLTRTIFPNQTFTSTFYDAAASRVAYTVDPRGVTNAFGYDGAGRQVAVTNALGIAALQAVNRYSYDAAGNQTNMVDALGRTTTYIYDALNRRTQTIYPDGTRQITGYDVLGRRIFETDRATNTTRFAYDGLGRLRYVTNALNHVTSYTYDENGNLLTQTDAKNRVTAFEYDALSRRTKRVMPGGEAESFGYDAVGNLLAHTNFNGLVLTNKYDSMNRLLSRHIATNGQALETYGYSASGQRITMANASGTNSFVYDECGRLKTNSAPQGTLFYTYDANGNVLTIKSSTSNGTDLTYQYDALNRLTNVIDARLSGMPGNNARYRFDPVGNLQMSAYPNGLTNVYQYDSLYRLTNLSWKMNGSARGDFGYTLTTAGNRAALNETLNGASQTYAWTYDAVQRLTQETISGTAPTGTLGYNYDAVGNRTNRSGTIGSLGSATYSYGSNDWLTADSYDKNGNTTNSSGAVYRYDYANRLTNFVTGTTNVVMAYNADGHRVSKIVSGTTTLYLVDDRNPTGYAQVFEELTVSGGSTNLSRAYSYGLDLISQRQLSPVLTTFYGYDGLGSVRFLTDTNGNITDTYVYDAYGTLISSSGTTANSYLFAGEQWDRDLNSYFLRKRLLNPQTGRFLTGDPFEGDQFDPLSLHRYLYAHDNPVNRIDPSGMNDFSLGSFMTTVSKAAGLAANVAYRVMPLANRVTIVLYESISGSTVVGGAGLLTGGKVAVTVVGGSTKFIDPLAKAHSEKIALAAFEEAGKYGVWPWRILNKLVPIGSELEKHHLIEQRFAETLRVLADDIPAIALSKAEHLKYTARWREQIARKNMLDRGLRTDTATDQKIWEAAQEVYDDAPELLEFVKVFMGR